MKKIVPEKQVFQHHFPISRNNDLQKKALKSNDTQNISHHPGVFIIPNLSLGILFLIPSPWPFSPSLPSPPSFFISSPPQVITQTQRSFVITVPSLHPTWQPTGCYFFANLFGSHRLRERGKVPRRDPVLAFKLVSWVTSNQSLHLSGFPSKAKMQWIWECFQRAS